MYTIENDCAFIYGRLREGYLHFPLSWCISTGFRGLVWELILIKVVNFHYHCFTSAKNNS